MILPERLPVVDRKYSATRFPYHLAFLPSPACRLSRYPQLDHWLDRTEVADGYIGRILTRRQFQLVRVIPGEKLCWRNQWQGRELINVVNGSIVQQEGDQVTVFTDRDSILLVRRAWWERNKEN